VYLFVLGLFCLALYTCQEVILYLSSYTTLTRLNMHVRRYYIIYHLTLHWQGCIYMSEGTTLFITSNWTEKTSVHNIPAIPWFVEIKCVFICSWIVLSWIVYFISSLLLLHTALRWSLYTTLTRLYIHIRR
jgi:hypothetical protein